jgi:hypothetical protein
VTGLSILEKEIKKVRHSSSRILNVDETGITTVHCKHQKAVSLMSKKKVAALTSILLSSA